MLAACLCAMMCWTDLNKSVHEVVNIRVERLEMHALQHATGVAGSYCMMSQRHQKAMCASAHVGTNRSQRQTRLS